MTSDITKKSKSLYIAFSIVSFLLTFGPLIYFVCLGYANSDVTREKVTLTVTIVFALVLTIINVLFKYSIRSTIWLILLGIYVCIDNIVPLLIMLAVGSILDEFLVTPLAKMFRSKYKINKEIDKRL